MNPHAPAPTSVVSLLQSLVRNRDLIMQMTRRDVVGRYKGSVMGLMWSFANPVFLLLIYTFVFSVVFKARWGTEASDSKGQFAIILFSGMIVHGLMAEVLIRAPRLIFENASYVKKMVFPLEVLPVVIMGGAIFHAMVSIFVLVSASFLLKGEVTWTAIYFPIILLPMILLCIGLAWVIASLGVFVPDIAHPVGLCVTILLFASPVFYPLTALPEGYRPWLMINPLTFIIEQVRAVFIFGLQPDWLGLLIYSAIAVTISWVGYVFFQKTRKGFANVL